MVDEYVCIPCGWASPPQFRFPLWSMNTYFKFLQECPSIRSSDSSMVDEYATWSGTTIVMLSAVQIPLWSMNTLQHKLLPWKGGSDSLWSMNTSSSPPVWFLVFSDSLMVWWIRRTLGNTPEAVTQFRFPLWSMNTRKGGYTVLVRWSSDSSMVDEYDKELPPTTCAITFRFPLWSIKYAAKKRRNKRGENVQTSLSVDEYPWKCHVSVFVLFVQIPLWTMNTSLEYMK